MGSTIQSFCKKFFSLSGIDEKPTKISSIKEKVRSSYTPPVAYRKKTINHIKNTLSDDFDKIKKEKSYLM